MEDTEFYSKLKTALEAFDQRLSSIENTVNTLTGAIEQASDEYEDSENYSAFTEKYGKDIEPLTPKYKILFGDDYDLSRELYDSLKETDGYGTEGFDEEGTMKARLEDLKSRISGLREEVEEIAETVEEEKPEEKPSEGLSEESLMKELQEAMEY